MNRPDPQRREPLLSRLREAFLARGYEAITMIELARLVGLSRRMLYNHFSNKTEAFRYMLWHDGEVAIANGLAAGDYRYRMFVAVGTLEDVRRAMAALVAEHAGR